MKLLIESLLIIRLFVSALQHNVATSNQVILLPQNIHFPMTHSCQLGLQCCLCQLKDTCPRKVGQRLGIPLMAGVGLSVGIISHIYICMQWPPSVMK